MIRLFIPLFVACLGFSLVGCGSYDVKHPTVAQMDELDVQWGLTKRVPKGGAKRLLNPDAAAAMGVSTPATPTPAAPATGATPPAAATMPTAPAPAPSAVDPAVINTLR
jgi:hypothetical protein